MQVPQQYNRLMPYMILPNAYEFIAFMKEVFNAEQQVVVPREEGIIMHGELRIGEAVIMFADVTDAFPVKPGGVFIYVESVDETFKKGLASGAKPLMEPAQQEYGYSCGFEDPFGNSWWVTQG